MKHLLSFAEKVVRDPRQITPADVAELRLEGFSDRAILDATHVAGFFSYMNRVVQGLGADAKASVAVLEQKEFSEVPSFSKAVQQS